MAEQHNSPQKGSILWRKLAGTESCPQKGGVLWRKLAGTESCPQKGGGLWRKQVWEQEPGRETGVPLS